MSFNRKRHYDDDVQEFRKRSRPSSRMEDFKALCNDINTLGETPKKYVEDVEFMSTPIVKNFESEDFRKAVLQTLFAVVTEQPQKILHISGLVQSVYSQAPDSAKIIVEFFHQEAQVLLEKAASRDAEPISSDTGPWNKIKLLMRFWASLSLILDTSSVVNVFSQFLKLSVDLQNNTPEKRSPLGEAIYYNTLISLPYLSPFHPDQSEVQHGANKVLQLAKEFKFVASEVTITKPFSESSEHQPYTPKEIVTCVLPALEEYFADTDKTNLFLDLQSMLGGLLSPAEKMTLPALALPTVDSLKEVVGLDTGLGSVDGMWRTPRFTMEVYLPIGDLHTTPSSSSYIGLLFRDIITDVIEAVEFNRKEVARQIITIDLFFNDAIFAPPGSSIDSLKKLNEQNKEGGTSLSTWKIEDIAVETILSLIFKLPTASQPSVYFYTTLVEACVNAPQAIAQVIGRAIRFFYANVYHLDFELNLRYLDWLSIQLSNFNFTWKWNEWEGDSVKFGKSNYHPRVVFIRNLVAKELRLGTRERIQATLTPEFQQYLDVSLFTKKELFVYYKNILGDIEDSEESLNLLYLCDQLPIKANVEKLIEVIHKNLPSAELEDAVQQLKVAIESFQNADELLVSIMFQAVAFVGSKSTSHAGKCIDSTREQLKKLVDIADASDDASGDVQMQEDNVSLKKQIWAINAVLAYWNQDPQSGYLVLDVLESFNIISPLAIIQHSLDDERKANLGLVNIASIESILRTLTKVVFSGSGTSELEYIFESLLSIISKIVSTLGTEGSIHIPDVSAEITDDIEFSWKYHTTLGLIRTVLRKFSDEYSGMAPALVSTLEKTVTHKDTVTIVSSWIKDLQSL